eukprot:15364944-Ditylum_brightwellii.AAC.4
MNQYLTPSPEQIIASIPFNLALLTDIYLNNIPLSKTNGYIDDSITIALDLPAIVKQVEAVLPLALHLMFPPLSDNEPICHTNVLSLRKLVAEGTLCEILKYIGWLINTRAFTIAL